MVLVNSVWLSVLPLTIKQKPRIKRQYIIKYATTLL